MPGAPQSSAIAYGLDNIMGGHPNRFVNHQDAGDCVLEILTIHLVFPPAADLSKL
jgi:hypothetical protein